MNLLNKLTIKSLKLNKKRTIVTIIGIMLSVALITAVATMYSSMIKTMINYETYEKGNFHVAYFDVPINEVRTIKNTREVEDVYLTSDIGYAKLENSKNEYKPYIFVKGFTKSSLENLSVKLVDGRLPENEDEIIIPTHLKTNGRVVMNIGDTITLDIGKRIAVDINYELNQDNPFQENNEDIVDTTKRTYKIVGIIERPADNIEAYTAPGYTFITYMNEQNMTEAVDVYAKYTKKGSKEYTNLTASILEIDKEMFARVYSPIGFDNSEEANKVFDELEKAKYKYDVNKYLITLENNPLNNDTSGGLISVVVIVIIIIIVTSVFCIKNSFDISITEKIKQYGMLRSIGATKKQIKKNVFYEGTILGAIGIPLGLLSGLLASYILVIVSNIFLKDMFAADKIKLVLSYSWIAFAIAILLGIVTIYLSALRSARKAAKVSPIEGLRNSSNIKIKAKKIKCPKVIKKIFKIGGEISYKNLKRNKKKYRTTIISIVVSVSIFIALSFFINSAFDVTNNEINRRDYNLSLHKYESAGKDFEEKARSTVELDNVEDYAIYRAYICYFKNTKYNEEYITLMKIDKENIENDGYVTMVSIGDYQYKKYLKSLNLDYDEYKNKGILIDNITIFYQKDGEDAKKKLRKFDYENGDNIEIAGEAGKTIEVGYNTEKWPFGNKGGYNTALIVSDEIFDKYVEQNKYEFDIYYDSNNASKLQDDIDLLLEQDGYSLNNTEENAKMMKNLYTLVAIFLYGFIIVISLIGITNIFNTITTNMELRKQDFAMLKSIGMTKKEFNNMIRLESIFMGLKALLIGIPIGIGLSYLMYKALVLEEGVPFKPPVVAILISIASVYLLITILMKYSMNKINKQNTIETIRNENI